MGPPLGHRIGGRHPAVRRGERRTRPRPVLEGGRPSVSPRSARTACARARAVRTPRRVARFSAPNRAYVGMTPRAVPSTPPTEQPGPNPTKAFLTAEEAAAV